MPLLHPFRLSGVSGGGWNGLAIRCGGWKTAFISEVLDETKLAKDWESEEAVDCSCDCRLPALLRLLLRSDFACASGLGLDSVFNLRRIPDIAYDTGYVKYDEDRLGVARFGGGDVCEDGERKGEEDGDSSERDMMSN